MQLIYLRLGTSSNITFLAVFSWTGFENLMLMIPENDDSRLDILGQLAGTGDIEVTLTPEEIEGLDDEAISKLYAQRIQEIKSANKPEDFSVLALPPYQLTLHILSGFNCSYDLCLLIPDNFCRAWLQQRQRSKSVRQLRKNRRKQQRSKRILSSSDLKH